MSHLIVIPVYNEAASIAPVVAAARAHGPVLVIDDGSDDGSAEAAARAGAEVVRHPRRLGKGQALRTGIAAARARGACAVATLDGDGQHDPDDLALLLAAAERRPGAIVVGSRLGARGAGAAGLPRGRRNAIRIAGFFVNWASGASLRDTQSGFRVYPLAVLDGVPTRHGGFVFETEILVEAARRALPIVEVDVTVRPRTRQRSRFRPGSDGIAIGAYLGGRALARWMVELAAAGRETASVIAPERRRARHAAMLAAAAPYAGAPGTWAWACGATVARRCVDCLDGWWRHPRRRRAAVAAPATAGAPLVLSLVLLQTLTGDRVPDFVTPLVSALYSQDRLDRARSAPRLAADEAPDEGARLDLDTSAVTAPRMGRR